MCKGPGAALSLARELVSCRRSPASACSMSVGSVSRPGGLQSSPPNKAWSLLIALPTYSVTCLLSTRSRTCQTRSVRSDREEGVGGQVGALVGV